MQKYTTQPVPLGEHSEVQVTQLKGCTLITRSPKHRQTRQIKIIETEKIRCAKFFLCSPIQL